MYGPLEVKRIQQAFTGKLSLTEPQRQRLRDFNEKSKMQGSLVPFLPLMETDPALFKKLSEDKRVEAFSIFAFFPATYNLIYGSENPKMWVAGTGTRGCSFAIEANGSKVVIKPEQNSREPKIAKLASELKAGPKQLESLEGYISEEFIEGCSVPKLSGDNLSEDGFFKFGKQFGALLSSLHANGIYYNDTMLADDFGKSHVIVGSGSKVTIIDYGAAISLENYPNFTRDEAYDYLRTTPESAFFVLGDGSFPEKLIEDVRTNMSHTAKDKILDRDLEFVSIGMYFASMDIGSKMNHFEKGFNSSYQRS